VRIDTVTSSLSASVSLQRNLNNGVTAVCRHLGIKTITSTQFVLIVEPTFTFPFFKFNMVQIKLSVAFILAAAAIAPVVALVPRYYAGISYMESVSMSHDC
jgi:hypothetical protein